MALFGVLDRIATTLDGMHDVMRFNVSFELRCRRAC
jgi:hypothetical protein